MLGLKLAGMFTLNKAVAVATKQKFYIVFPISFSILFICLFIGELIGNLKLGSYLCIAFSVIATLYLLYKLSITNNKKLFLYSLSCDLFFFTSIIVLLFIINEGMVVGIGDENTHWATVVKSMFVTGRPSYDSSNWLYFQNYMPVISLFEYYLLDSLWLESTLYIAMDLLLIGFFVPIFGFIKGSVISRLIYAFYFALSVFFFMPKTGRTLQVDSILLILFANLLIANYYLENKFRYVYLFSGMLALCFAKESGVVFSVIILLIATLDDIKHKRVNYMFLLTSGVSLVTIPWVWKKICELNNAVTLEKRTTINIKTILSYVTGREDAYKYEIAKGFCKQFLNKTAGSNISLIIYILIVVFILLWASYRDKSITGYVLIIGIIAYFIYLLFMYSIMWERDIGENLYGFQRYAGTIIGAVFIYCIAKTNYLITAGFGVKVLFLLLLILGLPLWNLKGSFVSNLISIERDNNRYQEVYALPAKWVESLDYNADKVYIISEASAGRGSVSYVDYWRTRYEIAPIKTNQFPDYEKPVYTCDEWEKLLREEYTYVYLYAIDEEFISEYGDLFEDAPNNCTIYRVNKDTGAKRLLAVASE
jgi:hypothetical protein